MAILRSTGFRLRPIRLGDATSIAQNANDEEIYRNTFALPYPYRLRDARNFVRHQAIVRQKQSPDSVVWGIEIGGNVVGCIGLHRIQLRHKAEIGYWLGRPYWGRGIMTRAVRLVVRYGFKTMRLQRIYAFTYLWNAASQRVLLKAGFKREGLLRKNVVKKGKAYDDYLFSIIR